MHTIRSMLMCGVASSVLAGCAIHPVPEDVTRKNTYKIVQAIRCEARDAVTDELAEELSRHPASEPLAQRLQSRDLKVQEFVHLYNLNAPEIVSVIHPKSERRIAAYRAASIGLDFQFDITEINDKTFVANLADPFTRGLFGLQLTSGDKRVRQNVRMFQVVDLFDKLLTDDALIEYCSNETESFSGNWIYPITGNIGIKEVLGTFLDLAEYVGYREKTDFSDKLVFTTNYYGTADPKITITAMNSSFHLDDVAGTGKADRRDIHQVTIAFALPVTTEGAPTAAGRPRGVDTEAEVLRILKERETEEFFEDQRAISDAFRDFLNQ